MAQAQDCLLPTEITSENVSQRFVVTRKKQDDSHRKDAATASGNLRTEIIPVKTKIVDPKTGDEAPVTICVDDGFRPGPTLAKAGRPLPVHNEAAKARHFLDLLRDALSHSP